MSLDFVSTIHQTHIFKMFYIIYAFFPEDNPILDTCVSMNITGVDSGRAEGGVPAF